jgi:hypothetical protein
MRLQPRQLVFHGMRCPSWGLQRCRSVGRCRGRRRSKRACFFHALIDSRSRMVGAAWVFGRSPRPPGSLARLRLGWLRRCAILCGSLLGTQALSL